MHMCIRNYVFTIVFVIVVVLHYILMRIGYSEKDKEMGKDLPTSGNFTPPSTSYK